MTTAATTARSSTALSALPLRVPLERHIARIVRQLRILVNAVYVHPDPSVHIAVRDQLLLLLLRPIATALESGRYQLLLQLPRPLDRPFVRVLQNPMTLLLRINSVLDDHDRIRTVQTQFLPIRSTMIVDFVRGNVKHTAKPAQLLRIIAQLHHVVRLVENTQTNLFLSHFCIISHILFL